MPSAVTARRRTLGGSPRRPDNFDYLRSVADFKKSVRRRESLRSAKCSKEYDLEQRIALEIKMREGSSKLLAATSVNRRHLPPQALEAAKNLLTSKQRMAAYMAELQGRRGGRAGAGRLAGGARRVGARVCLSELRVPLMWGAGDHFRNRGDFRRFGVFALVKVGSDIYDTQMINPVDRNCTDVCFDDVVIFEDVPPHFTLTVELYSCLLSHDLSIASTPRKLRNSLHSSISRTVGRRLANSAREAAEAEGPPLRLEGVLTLTAADARADVATHELTALAKDSPTSRLPLFGHACCRLAAAPNGGEVIAGLCGVQVAGSAPTPGWVRVAGWRLEVWGSEGEAATSEHHPNTTLSVDRDTNAALTAPLSLRLSNSSGLERGSLSLSLPDEATAQRWLLQLRQVCSDHLSWGGAALEEQEVAAPTVPRPYPAGRKHTNLYDETAISDCSSASSKSSSDDLFSPSLTSSAYSSASSFASSVSPPALAPLPPPRPRALTLSRASFRRWGSARFFRN